MLENHLMPPGDWIEQYADDRLKLAYANNSGWATPYLKGLAAQYPGWHLIEDNHDVQPIGYATVEAYELRDRLPGSRLIQLNELRGDYIFPGPEREFVALDIPQKDEWGRSYLLAKSVHPEALLQGLWVVRAIKWPYEGFKFALEALVRAGVAITLLLLGGMAIAGLSLFVVYWLWVLWQCLLPLGNHIVETGGDVVWYFTNYQ